MVPRLPENFSEIAPAGHYVALRLGFAFPVEEFNEFPPDWIEHYTRGGLMLRDPVVKWVYESSGTARWSDLTDSDSYGVLKCAARFGLKFGAVVNYVPNNPKEERSYGTFARSDREFTDDELKSLGLKLRKMHDLSIPPKDLTVAELEALRLVKEGLRLKEIAFRLGVSEGAIKQRLAGAKRKLGARTNTHAASLAVSFRMI